MVTAECDNLGSKLNRPKTITTYIRLLSKLTHLKILYSRRTKCIKDSLFLLECRISYMYDTNIYSFVSAYAER